MVDRNSFVPFGHERRTSFQRQLCQEGNDFSDDTRVTLVFGHCLNVKAEKDEGIIKIGGFALANNCNLILLLFGFFFLLPGIVLTIVSYKPSTIPSTSVTPKFTDSTSRQEGKIAGPLFILVGFILFTIGTGLSIIYWRLNRKTKRKIHNFTLRPSCPPSPNPTHFVGDPVVQISYSSSKRRDSNTSSTFFPMRNTVATVSPPFFAGESSADCQHVDTSSKNSLLEILGGEDDQRKPSLSLRPSVVIPILTSPTFMRNHSVSPLQYENTRSDEPFGSIAGLAGTGDIACFPSHSTTVCAFDRNNELSSSQRNSTYRKIK